MARTKQTDIVAGEDPVFDQSDAVTTDVAGVADALAAAPVADVVVAEPAPEAELNAAEPAAEKFGRALIDLPAHGLLSGDYATLPADIADALAAIGVFDPNAIEVSA